MFYCYAFAYPIQDIARGLQDLLEYDGDVESDFGLSFEVVRQFQFMLINTHTYMRVCIYIYMCVCGWVYMWMHIASLLSSLLS